MGYRHTGATSNVTGIGDERLTSILATKPGAARRTTPYRPETWTQDAVCAEDEAEIEWFQALGGVPADLAKAMCTRCPVADICFGEAIRRDERHGIWGGVQFGCPGEWCPNARHELAMVARPTKRQPGRMRCLNCERDETKRRRTATGLIRAEQIGRAS